MSAFRRLLSLCKPRAAQDSAAASARLPEHTTRPTVLVVEDHPDVADSLRRSLEQLHIFSAVSLAGETAVKMAEVMHFDLIILDILLPGMNGFEVCRAIRGMAHLRDVPVMFVTCVLAPEARLEADRLGAKCYLTKPFELGDFQKEVEAILGTSPQKPAAN